MVEGGGAGRAEHRRLLPLLFLAAYRLPGGLAAVVGSVGPLLVLGLSALLLGRRPALRDVLAGTVAALGVSMVVLRAAGALDALGVAAAFASTASMAAGTVLTQKWGRPEESARSRSRAGN